MMNLIVGMWKTSLKQTRYKSSYPFSIWESHFWSTLRCNGFGFLLWKFAVRRGCLVIAVTTIVSGWEILHCLRCHACDLVNMQVYF
jgi:hypothetical protein